MRFILSVSIFEKELEKLFMFRFYKWCAVGCHCEHFLLL